MAPWRSSVLLLLRQESFVCARLWTRSCASFEGGTLQTSLSKATVVRSGIGLHSGKKCSVTIFPSNAGTGRIFTLENERDVQVPATADFVVATKLSTCIGRGTVKVCTVEHVLAALECLGVDNCRIHLEGNNEVPLLDGSALHWVEAIDEAGICAAKDEAGSYLPRRQHKLKEAIHVTNGDSFVAAFPSPITKATYGIDFPEYPAIGKQWSTHFPDPAAFRVELASARTFGLYEQIDMLIAAGLIKGGCLDNALVCSREKGWLNPPLRFPDEPCRHKLLDLLGDLSLCSRAGHPGLPIAHIVAYKVVFICFLCMSTEFTSQASHALHIEFCNTLLQSLKVEEQQVMTNTLEM